MLNLSLVVVCIELFRSGLRASFCHFNLCGLHTDGYMEHIFRHAAQELYGVDVQEGPLSMETVRNSDFQEVSLKVHCSKPS